MRYLHCVRPVLAKKLVEKFGAEVLTVIETRTAELQSVDGIGPKRRERIAHAWREASKSAKSCCSCTATASAPVEPCGYSRPTASRQLQRCARTHTRWQRIFTGSALRP